MNKYKLEHEFEWFGDTTEKRTIEFQSDSLQDVLDTFSLFLKGIGFQVDGVLTFVDYDDTLVCDICFKDVLVDTLGEK